MKIIIGDIVEISLTNGSKAYGRYVFWDEKMGPLLQIYDLIVDGDITMEDIEKAKPMFPPVITGLFAAIKKGLWKVIGNIPVREFKYPGYVSTLYDEKTGKASTWYLWNGSDSIRLGKRLPNRYKDLEYLVVWSLEDIIDRIETGEYPYPYKDLIRLNRCTRRSNRTQKPDQGAQLG